MDPDHKIKTRNFLVTVFRTFDVSNDGRLSRAEVDRVLAALGRRVEPATVDGIVERFSGDGEGKEGKKGKGREGIDWLQGDFLKEVAAINVTNVNLIEEFVFSAAFSTFDQDADGYINPIEMKAVLKLFLPLESQKDDENMTKIIDRMDSNNDGMITYDEFVQSVKTSGDSDLYRYIEPVMSVGFTVMGFLVYSVSLYVGLSVAWYTSYD